MYNKSFRLYIDVSLLDTTVEGIMNQIRIHIAVHGSISVHKLCHVFKKRADSRYDGLGWTSSDSFRIVDPPDQTSLIWFQADQPIDLIAETAPVDIVNHPPHYQSNTGLEVIEAIKAFVEDYPSYCAGNVLKYVCRYRHKNGLEDLKKARWYLDELINHIEKESNQND